MLTSRKHSAKADPALKDLMLIVQKPSHCTVGTTASVAGYTVESKGIAKAGLSLKGTARPSGHHRETTKLSIEPCTIQILTVR